MIQNSLDSYIYSSGDGETSMKYNNGQKTYPYYLKITVKNGSAYVSPDWKQNVVILFRRKFIPKGFSQTCNMENMCYHTILKDS